MLPLLKNHSELSYPSTTGRSDDILGKRFISNSVYFPYLQDLRLAIQKPQLLKNKDFKIKRPDSLHAEYKEKFEKNQEPSREEKEQNYYESPDFIKKLKNFKKKSSRRKAKTPLNKTTNHENVKPKDFKEKFPRLDKLIDSIIQIEENKSEMIYNNVEMEKEWHNDEKKTHFERFLGAQLKFFSYKEKNQILKDKCHTKFVDLDELNKFKLKIQEIGPKKNLQLKSQSQRTHFQKKSFSVPLVINNHLKAEPKMEIQSFREEKMKRSGTFIKTNKKKSGKDFFCLEAKFTKFKTKRLFKIRKIWLLWTEKIPSEI